MSIRKIIIVIFIFLSFGQIFSQVTDTTVLYQSEDKDNSPSYHIYDPLQHQEKAMNVLLGWSILSVDSGTAMIFSDRMLIRNFGWQNIAWGAIDAGIALWAKSSLEKKRVFGIDPVEEIQYFRKVLLINTLLDIVYIGIGAALVRSSNEKLNGHGYGVLIQGSFLFLFDGINYLITVPF